MNLNISTDINKFMKNDIQIRLHAKIFYLIFFFLFPNLIFSQNNKFAGDYIYHNKPDKEYDSVIKRLKLTDCGVFFLNVEPYDYEINYSGYWYVKGDTLFLQTNEFVYCITELSQTNDSYYKISFNEVFCNCHSDKRIVTLTNFNDTIEIIETKEDVLKIPFSDNLKRISFKCSLINENEFYIETDKINSNNFEIAFGQNQDMLFDTCFLIKKKSKILRNCNNIKEKFKKSE